MARYGNQTTPFHEEMSPKPVDPYGISKVASEDVLKNLCDLRFTESKSCSIRGIKVEIDTIDQNTKRDWNKIKDLILDSNFINGKEVSLFEKGFKKFCNVKHRNIRVKNFRSEKIDLARGFSILAMTFAVLPDFFILLCKEIMSSFFLTKDMAIHSIFSERTNLRSEKSFFQVVKNSFELSFWQCYNTYKYRIHSKLTYLK